MRRAGASGAVLALAMLAVPAQAQFGGLFNSAARTTDKTENGCPKGKKRSAGSQIFGSIVGSVAGGAASS